MPVEVPERLLREQHAVRREVAPPPLPRPRTRADCRAGPRPCPWVGCRYCLFLDVRQSGRINYPHKRRPPWRIDPSLSCALDLAEEGSQTYATIGEALGLTHEGARRVLLAALASVRRVDVEVWEALVGLEGA